MVIVVLGFKLPFAAISHGCAQVQDKRLRRDTVLHNLINPIREVEGGKEICNGQRDRAQEGDQEGEASQEGKG